jgi:hypothetical protein
MRERVEDHGDKATITEEEAQALARLCWLLRRQLLLRGYARLVPDAEPPRPRESNSALRVRAESAPRRRRLSKEQRQAVDSYERGLRRGR